MATEVPVETLKHEVEFYDNTEKVMKDIGNFRERLDAQNEEFNLLLEYYVQHRAHLDVYHGQGHRRPMQPNLGTEDESWYYIDGRGNKIWVKNLTLQTGLQRDGKGTGAFAEGSQADGRKIIVSVPKHKQSAAPHANYRHACDEYDAYRLRSDPAYRRGGGSRPATAGVPSSRLGGGGGGGYREDPDEQYIQLQQELHKALGSRPTSATVKRPPATVEEAQERLRQLKEEEKYLLLHS